MTLCLRQFTRAILSGAAWPQVTGLNGSVGILSETLIFSDIRKMVIRWAFCKLCSQFFCSLILLKIVFRVRNS
jgi:hypothetical protein